MSIWRLQGNAPIEVCELGDLVAFDTKTEKRTMLVSAKEFVPHGARKALDVQAYRWSEDQLKLLIFTNSQRVWRRTRVAITGR